MKSAMKTVLGVIGSLLGVVVFVVLLRRLMDILIFLSEVDIAIMARLGWFYIAYIIVLIAVIGTLIYLIATKYNRTARIACIAGLVVTGPFLIGAFWHAVAFVGGGIG